jgi:tRNA(Ile)-lysidine synthase
LTEQNNIGFYTSSKNIKLFAKRNGLSIEEAGREIRYKELKRFANKNKFNIIATAHHSDDNSETVLLNIIKGTGLKGLSGIPLRRENIVRPLLCLTKDEIIDYLNKKKINYCVDKSNLENDFQRNFLRNEIIPLVKNKLNPQFDNAVFRMTGIIKELSYFVEDEIAQAIKSAAAFDGNELKIMLAGYNSLNPYLQGEFFKAVVNRYFQIELDHQKIADLKKLTSNELGKRIDLKGKLFALKERDYLLISQQKKTERIAGPQYLEWDEAKQVGEHTFSISEVRKSIVSYEHSSNLEYISADKIKKSFILRKWKNGDRFFPLGMKNAKKVSDFLNEQKIESFKKKEHLVLINSGNIVWVVGLRIDDRYKITDRTKKVLKLCLN